MGERWRETSSFSKVLFTLGLNLAQHELRYIRHFQVPQHHEGGKSLNALCCPAKKTRENLLTNSQTGK